MSVKVRGTPLFLLRSILVQIVCVFCFLLSVCSYATSDPAIIEKIVLGIGSPFDSAGDPQQTENLSLCSQVNWITSRFSDAQKASIQSLYGTPSNAKSLTFYTVLEFLEFIKESLQAISPFMSEESLQEFFNDILGTDADEELPSLKYFIESCTHATYGNVILLTGNKNSQADSQTIWGTIKKINDKLMLEGKKLLQSKIFPLFEEDYLDLLGFSAAEKDDISSEKTKISNVLNFFWNAMSSPDFFDGQYYKFPFETFVTFLSTESFIVAGEDDGSPSLSERALLKSSERFLAELFNAPLVDLFTTNDFSIEKLLIQAQETLEDQQEAEAVLFLIGSDSDVLTIRNTGQPSLMALLNKVKHLLSLPYFFLSTESYTKIVQLLGISSDQTRTKKARTLFSSLSYLLTRAQEGKLSYSICLDIIGDVNDNDSNNRSAFYLFASILTKIIQCYVDFEFDSTFLSDQQIFSRIRQLYEYLSEITDKTESLQNLAQAIGDPTIPTGWFKDAKNCPVFFQQAVEKGAPHSQIYHKQIIVEELSTLLQNISLTDLVLESLLDFIEIQFDLLLDKNPCPVCYAFATSLKEITFLAQSFQNSLAQFSEDQKKEFIAQNSLEIITHFIDQVILCFQEADQAENDSCSFSFVLSPYEWCQDFHQQFETACFENAWPYVPPVKSFYHNSGCSSLPDLIQELDEVLKGLINFFCPTNEEESIFLCPQFGPLVELNDKLWSLQKIIQVTAAKKCPYCSVSFTSFFQDLDTFTTLLQETESFLLTQHQDKLLQQWLYILNALIPMTLNIPSSLSCEQTQELLESPAFQTGLDQALVTLKAIEQNLQSQKITDPLLEEDDIALYKTLGQLLETFGTKVLPYYPGIGNYGELNANLSGEEKALALFQQFVQTFEKINQFAEEFLISMETNDILQVSWSVISDFVSLSQIVQSLCLSIASIPDFFETSSTPIKSVLQTLSDTLKDIRLALQQKCPYKFQCTLNTYIQNLCGLSCHIQQLTPDMFASLTDTMVFLFQDIASIMNNPIECAGSFANRSSTSPCLHSEYEEALKKENQILQQADQRLIAFLEQQGVMADTLENTPDFAFDVGLSLDEQKETLDQIFDTLCSFIHQIISDIVDQSFVNEHNQCCFSLIQALLDIQSFCQKSFFSQRDLQTGSQPFCVYDPSLSFFPLLSSFLSQNCTLALESWIDFLKQQSPCLDKLIPFLHPFVLKTQSINQALSELVLSDFKNEDFQAQIKRTLNALLQEIDSICTLSEGSSCIFDVSAHLANMDNAIHISIFPLDQEKAQEKTLSETLQNIHLNLIQTKDIVSCFQLNPASFPSTEQGKADAQTFTDFAFKVCKQIKKIADGLVLLSQNLDQFSCLQQKGQKELIQMDLHNIIDDLYGISTIGCNRIYKFLELLFLNECKMYEEEIRQDLALDAEGLAKWVPNTSFHNEHTLKQLKKLANQFIPEVRPNEKICEGIKPKF